MSCVLALDNTKPEVQTAISTRLGHFHTACHLRGTVNKYWQGFYGDGRFVHCPAKHFDFGADDEIEMLPGFDGQQLKVALRLRDPAPTPVPHHLWISVYTTRVDEMQIFDQICSALSLPPVEHDWADIVQIPPPRQCALLASGIFPVVIKGGNDRKQMVLVTHNLLLPPELVKSIGAGNRTTFRRDATVQPPQLLWWSPRTKQEVMVDSTTVTLIMQKHDEVMKSEKGKKIGKLDSFNRESFAKLLVEEGLASVHAYSAEKSGNANELFAAEKKAKDARKGLWHDWDPSKDAVEDGDDFAEAPGSIVITVV